MSSPKKSHSPTKEINAIIDKILKKNKRKKRNAKRQRKEKKIMPHSNFRKCQFVENEGFNNGVESSTRFSIRVMEAMRSLQRTSQNPSLTLSNSKDIARYIKTNYRFDGDLAAQVRTVLSRIRRQGMILKIGKEYHLMGPFASLMNKSESYTISKSERSRKRKRSRSRSRGSKCLKKGEKRRGRPKKGGKDAVTKGDILTKVIKDPEIYNHEGSPSNDQDENRLTNQNRSSSNFRINCPSNNQNRRRSRKSKNLKRKKCRLINSRCGLSNCYEKDKVNEDCQSVGSTGTFITCCDEFNAQSPTIRKKTFKSDVDECEGQCGLSYKKNECNSSSSDEDNSEDSTYKELMRKKSKAGCDSKDLKRWIRHCRRECTQ